jgi:hypothetical protein
VQATLTVTVTPADAPGMIIVVDGAPVTGGAIALAANPKKRVKVVVRAKGYNDWTKSLVVAADTTLDVKLTRKSIGNNGPGGALGL